jgi:DNA-binding XRE family transcriptional regulator
MKQYRIEALLADGEQWFDDLDPETFNALSTGVNGHADGELTVPIVISARGRLLDGHQRLTALMHNGRKMISAADIRIDHTAVDAETEALAAIAYQINRRQVTTAEKAKVARDLMARFSWSQATVAKRMGVTRPAVSQWFLGHPDPTAPVPTTVTGLDGKTYPVAPAPEPKAKRPRAQPDYSPVRVADDYALQLCNPGWGQWVRTWALDALDEERTAVADNLKLIASTCAMLANDLTTSTANAGGGF